jgi:hypothetical protein
MRAIIIVILVFAQSVANAQNGTYVLKEGLPLLDIYDLDSTGVLLYEEGAVAYNKPFTLYPQWILWPEVVTDSTVALSFDIELHPDTMIRFESSVPMALLQSIDHMEIPKRDSFMLRVLQQMYQYFTSDDEQLDAQGRAGEYYQLSDYSANTQTFFNRSFFFAESYIGRDILWELQNQVIWQQYLYVMSHEVWGAKAEGLHALAYLFAGRPVQFCQAFNEIKRMHNRAVIQEAIKQFFPALLYKPVMQNGSSDLLDLFEKYKDRQSDDRALLMLSHYVPYLQRLGLSEEAIAAIRSSKLK